MEVKKTPLNEMHRKYGGKLVDFAGWELPIQFRGISEEHLWVREKAGIFDVSHMGEIKITGRDAARFTDYLVTNDAGALDVNQVMYTFMCSEDGGVVDDLLVYKYSEERILLVINASNIEKDIQWIRENAEGYEVVIEDISPEVSQLAVQGPEAQKILQKLTDTDLEKIKFFRFQDGVRVAGKECLVSRTGYTGEDGFEIYAENEAAPEIWEAVLEAGGEMIQPVGLGARDTLRFEAGLPLYGNELTSEISPLEAGLGFFVKLEAGEFIGRENLSIQKSEGVRKKSAGFILKGRGIARGGYKVFAEGREIGHITTGYQVPGNTESIGLAMIEAEYAKIGTPIQIAVRKKMVDGEIISKKFKEKKYKK